MKRDTINTITVIALIIGVVGMWLTLGKALWYFFMAVSITSIIVFLLQEG